MQAEYTYDAYGYSVSATGSMADKNPIRYRGYYYDVESEFYYVNGRYYNPAIGRWLSPDSILACCKIRPSDSALVTFPVYAVATPDSDIGAGLTQPNGCHNIATNQLPSLQGGTHGVP